MPSLAIDTATEICALALGEGSRLIDETAPVAGRSHLEMLLDETHRLLARNGIKRSDIRSIVVGTGPGTFSGLRVGIATARALAQALAVPLSGSSTLKALAMGIAGCGEGQTGDPENNDYPDILPVIDAKRGQVFAQLFRLGEQGAPQAASRIMNLDPKDLLGRLPDMTRRRVLAAGNGVLAYLPLFEGCGAVETFARDDARHKVSAAHHLPAAVSGAYDPEALLEVTPVYVRDPDADKTVLLRKKEPWLK